MIELKDYEYNLLQRISKKLSIKIDIKEIDDKYYITNEEYHSAMDELYDYVCHLEEKIEELEQDMQENYEPKHYNPYTLYGVNKNDFS